MSKFLLKLIRADQAIGSIPTITEKDMIEDPVIDTNVLGNTICNDMKIQYCRRIGIVAVPVQVMSDNQGVTLFVLMSDGSVYSAGGLYGVNSLGDGTSDYGIDITDTRTVDYWGLFSAISVFDYQPLAITNTGQLVWWGNFGYYNYAQNSLGYAAYYDDLHVLQPALLPFNTLLPQEGITNISFNSVSIGYWCAAGIDTSGKLWTWGYGGSGTLGRALGDTYDRLPTPGEVVHPEGRTWSYVHVGNVGMSAIDDIGQWWNWGDNSYGMCGVGVGHSTINYFDTPQKVGTDTDWVKVISSETRNIGLKSNGEIWGCGYNYYKYWLNHSPNYPICGANEGGSNWCAHWTPYKMSGSHSFVDIGVGFYHVIALKSNGTVWGCGQDGYSGCLGLGSSIDYVLDWTQITQGGCILFNSIYSAYDVSLGIGVDNKAYMWGTFYGQPVSWDNPYPTHWTLPNEV